MIHLLACAVLLAQDDRQPVPEAAKIREAEKTVRGSFKDDYAKPSPIDRRILARKLLKKAMEPQDDPAVHYVLLREARDVGAQGSEIETAIKAIDEMGKHFVVDAPSAKLAALNATSRTAQTPVEFRKYTLQFLRLVAEAVAADKYDVAGQSATAASGFAKRAKDNELDARATARGKDVADLKARHEKVRKAQETLAANADDAAANAAVGQYLAFAKGNWSDGLSMMQKGNDAALSELARRELDGSEHVSVGDAWWDRGEKESGVARFNLRDHAVECYRRGSANAKTEKRVLDWRKERGGGWEDVTKPELFGLTGPSTAGLVVDVGSATSKVVTLKPFPDGDFDAVSARIYLPSGGKGAIIVESQAWLVVIDLSANPVIFNNRWENGKWAAGQQARLPKQDDYVLQVVVVKGEYVVSVDGVDKLRMTTAAKGMREVALQVEAGPVTFDEVRLRFRK